MKTNIVEDKKPEIQKAKTKYYLPSGIIFLWFGLAGFLITLPYSIDQTGIILDHPLTISNTFATIVTVIFIFVGILLIMTYFRRKKKIKQGIVYPEDSLPDEPEDEESEEEEEKPKLIKVPVKMN